MKNLYFFLLLAFFAFESNAQIITIPDPAFKNLLVNTNCTDVDGGDYTINGDVDTNNDGEIQVSEALAVTAFEFDSFDTVDLSGIEAFTNLKILNFFYFGHLNIDLSGVPSLIGLGIYSGTVTSLNLSGLTNLKEMYLNYLTLPMFDLSGLANLDTLYVTDSTIPSLDLSNLIKLKFVMISGDGPATVNLTGLTNLETLRFYTQNLTSLDLTDLVNLKELMCFGNQLTTLDLSHVSNLESLECSDNQLTTLDVSNLSHLYYMNCGGNQLTTLDVTNLPNLSALMCADNELTTLDLSNSLNLYNLKCAKNHLSSINTTNLTKLARIDVSDNLFSALDFSYSLSHTWNNLNFSNNPNLTYINIKNGAHFWFHQGDAFSAGNCDNLRYICANEENFYLIEVPQAQVNSYCSFTPGGAFNTISGMLTFDLNNNGCDAGDILSLGSKMKISDGTSNGIAFANAAGNYTFYTQTGNFTVTPEFENPYFTVSPTSAIVNFATADGFTQTQDFCIAPNGIHNDVEITIVPSIAPRPGFDAGYKLIYKNKGNQVLSGNVNFTFTDAVLDLVFTDTAVTNQTLNNLNWSYNDLLPFESRSINVVLNLNSPQEIPAVNTGDILNFSAAITPVSGDETVADNTFNLPQIVLGSYDPNDKICLEGDTITPELVGGYVHYVIRFQNSGTAPAENIVVKDVIDTAKFDMASFELTGSSHPHQTKISGNTVEFQFPNISLPTEINDEPGSHGYVAFKIKTNSNLGIGDAVENKADIYFDYNFPIETNTATTTVALLANDPFENKGVSVFPNPVKDQLHIMAKDNITTVQLYDIQGRLIETALANDTHFIFDLGKNTAGIYFVKVYTDNGVKVQKIIKE
jgi:uncharacterized repeat protein (TIGR01451 family)